MDLCTRHEVNDKQSKRGPRFSSPITFRLPHLGFQISQQIFDPIPVSLLLYNASQKRFLINSSKVLDDTQGEYCFFYLMKSKQVVFFVQFLAR